jgi:hypothetical protein
MNHPFHAFALAVLASATLAACSDSAVIVDEARSTSPDGAWEATTAAVRQASDAGRGESYTRVTLRETAASDQVPRVVFCTAASASPRIRWVDARHVLIRYDDGTRLACPETRPPGLVVAYEAVPLRVR